MSGGQRYWNEDTQRWEDGTADTAASVTPPPPPRPEFSPAAPAPGVPDGPAPPAAPHGPTAPDGDRPGGPPPAPVVPPGPAPAHPSAHDGTWSRPEPPSTVSWPYTESGAVAPAPAAGPRPSRRKVWSVLGGAAAAGIAAALVLTLLVGEDDDGKGGGGRDDRASSTSATPAPERPTPGTRDSGPSPQETATPSGPAASLPAEYEIYTDPEGFTLARPAGWRREAVASQYGMDVVNYRSADGERRLQVFEVAEASPDESFALFLSEETPKAEGFEQLTLESLDDGDVIGSRLEYLAGSVKGEPEIGTWHVVDVRFQATDGKVYAVAAYGPDADGRDDERELAGTAVGHFCPPDTDCGTAAGAL